MVTKVSGNLIQTATVTGNNIANGTITTNNISTSVNLGGPKIATITYPGDDTAADTAGGQSIVLTGNGFVTGASVLLDGVAVSSVTVTNTTSISFTSPAKSTGSYIVYVVNADGSTAIAVPGLQYSGTPTWTTPADTLGSAYEYAAVSATVAATGDTIAYALAAGNTLPDGVTLAANGQLSGTAPAQSGNTTFFFTVTATDAQNQSTDRQFSITLNTDAVTWSSPANNVTYTLAQNVANTTTLSASSAAGRDISYAANSLPTGLAVSGSTITGTPTVVANSSSLITATAATTGKTAVQTINWVINIAADAYWKNTTLLVGGTSNTVPNTFNQDASLNNAQLTIAGDTKPNNFSPYASGLYSGYFPGSVCVETTTATNKYTIPTSTTPFTVECWVYVATTGTPYTAICTSGTTYSYSLSFGSAIGTYDTTLKPWFGFYSGGWGGILSPVEIKRNRWYHIAGVFTGSATKIFIDGVEVASGGSATWGVNGSGTDNILVGKRNDDANYFTGHISNARVVIGTAVYTSAFTPSTVPLTAIANTRLLTCQSNRFIDNSPLNAPLAVGTAMRLSSAHPFNTTTASYNTQYCTRFDASGDYLTYTPGTSAQFGTGDFTVECWIYPTSALSTQYLIDMRDASHSSGWALAYGTNVSGKLTWYDGSGNKITENGSYTTLNAWNHIAYVRQSGVARLCINGVMVNVSVADTTNYNNNNTTAYIGSRFDQNNSVTSLFPGTISNLRIVKGTAVYTTAGTTQDTVAFTPPTAPLTAVANTTLLTCQDATLKDNSTNALAIASYGDAKPVALSPFAMTTSNTTITSLGSAYFDGTDDYLSYTAGLSLTGAFTAQCWFYNNTTTGSQRTLFSLNSASGNGYGSLRVDCDQGNVQNNLTAVLGTSGTSWSLTLSVNSIYAKNTWNHVAVTRDASNVVRLFLNGVQIATNTQTGTLYSTSTTHAIGCNNLPGTATNPFQGHISDLQVVNGSALYTSNFLPPQAPLTPVANTQLLTCQYNGGATNNGFVDQSNFNNLVVKAANATQGSFSPFSPNGWSTYFPGSTSQLSFASNAAFAYGTGDFTWEMWFNPSSAPNGLYLLDRGAGNAGTLSFNGTRLVYYTPTTGIGSTLYTTGFGNAFSIGTWYHVAAVRRSGTTYLYLNGTLTTSATDSTNYSAADTMIGQYGGGNLGFVGYISNVRLVKGLGVYTGAFTPPTTPLQNQQSSGTNIAAITTGVSLLASQSPSFVDNSSYRHTAGLISTPSVQAYSPFGGVSTSPISYSTYFDGDTDSIQCGTANFAAFGTGDFTIEMFVYLNAYSAGGYNTFLRADDTSSTVIDFGYDNTNSLLKFQTLTSTLFSGTYSFPLNQWIHIAASRVSGNLRVYANGNQIGTTLPNSTAWTAAPMNYKIGGNAYAANMSINGYISNFRTLKGTGLYSGTTLTVPTSPLTAISNTSLLTCQSTTIVDSSTNSFPLSVLGTPKPRNFNPFGSTANTGVTYSPSTHGGSMFFDGVGDKLTITNYPTLAFKANAFTIQGWFYTTAASTEQTIMTNGWSSYAPWLIRLNSSNQLMLNMSVGAGGSWYVSEAVLATITTRQWCHVAVTRSDAGILRAFVNGVQAYTTDLGTTALYDGSQNLNVGDRSDTATPFFGYITDVQLINGTSLYSANFVPPERPATVTGGTTMLLNGTNAGVLNAHGTNNLETTGHVTMAPESPYDGRYYSYYVDGLSKIDTASSANLTFGTGDFTIEFWFNAASRYSSYPGLISNSGSAGLSANQFMLCDRHASNANVLSLYIGNISTSTPALIGVTTITNGVWYHVALTRTGNTWRMFVNGNLDASTTNSTSLDTGTNNIINLGVNSSYNFQGYYSSVRVIKGQSLYTGAFTPSTSPLTSTAVGTSGANVAASITGTVSLITAQGNQFKDNSPSPLTVTASGSGAAKIKSFNPFQNNAVKSMYFDGTGDYVVMPYLQTPNILNGDFTIECWVYPTAAGNIRSILAQWHQSVGGGGYILAMDGSNGKFIFYFGPHSEGNSVYTGPSYKLNQWQHVAMVRQGNYFYMYVDGVTLGASASVTAGSVGIPHNTAIGNYYNSSSALGATGTSDFQGYIKDLRVTKGVARTITVPVEPLMWK